MNFDIDRIYKRTLKPHIKSSMPREKYIYWCHDFRDIEQYNSDINAEGIITALTETEKYFVKSVLNIFCTLVEKEIKEQKENLGYL